MNAVVTHKGTDIYNDYLSWWRERVPYASEELFSEFIIAVDGVCGTSMYWCEKDKMMFLTWMVSNPEARNVDVYLGFDLCFAKAKARSVELGAKLMFACTSNRALQRFIEKQGFKTTSEQVKELYLYT